MVRQGLLRRIGRTDLTLPEKTHEAHHDLTGRLSGDVYANSVAVTGVGGAQNVQFSLWAGIINK